MIYCNQKKMFHKVFILYFFYFIKFILLFFFYYIIKNIFIEILKFFLIALRRLGKEKKNKNNDIKNIEELFNKLTEAAHILLTNGYYNIIRKDFLYVFFLNK